jgi:hypothetical protein
MTVRSDTQTIRLTADADAAFEFVADPANLPKWAVGFCRSIRREDQHWVVETGAGECPMIVEVDPRRRTIDFHMSPAPQVTASAYSRVIDCGQGCEYVFTQFSVPGMPDAAFEANIEALKEELTVLRAVLNARHACPASAAAGAE